MSAHHLKQRSLPATVAELIRTKNYIFGRSVFRYIRTLFWWKALKGDIRTLLNLAKTYLLIAQDMEGWRKQVFSVYLLWRAKRCMTRAILKASKEKSLEKAIETIETEWWANDKPIEITVYDVITLMEILSTVSSIKQKFSMDIDRELDILDQCHAEVKHYGTEELSEKAETIMLPWKNYGVSERCIVE